MSEKKREADFTEEEAQRRFEATLKSALTTPPKKKTAEPKSKDQPKPKTTRG